MPAPPALRKGSSRSAIPSLSTITEEEEQEQISRRRRRRGDSDRHLRGDEKTSSGRTDTPALEPKIYTVHNTTHAHNTGRPEPLMLKLDERQRLARERREEKERQIAARELQWQERAERAQQYYERQLEERRRRMEEQRQKEERRRAAVEEKRQQKLQEEKARYEAVMKKTLEKSQKVRLKANRWSWGGALTPSISHKSDADRRSVSTMNLSKHTDPVITKRLSSSSATLINSTDRALQKRTSRSSSCLVNKTGSKVPASRDQAQQDKASGLRRMPLNPWENSVLNRLQAPTHSYLARSRSAMSLSGDAVTPICPRSASCHPMSSQSFKSLHSRSTERPIRAGLNFERPIRAGNVGLDATARRKTVHNMSADRKDKDYVRKSWSNLLYPTPNLTTPRTSTPVHQGCRASQPLAARSSAKPPQKPLLARNSRSPPPPASLPLSLGNSSLTLGNLRPNKESLESSEATVQDKKGTKKEKGTKRETGGTKEEEEAQREALGPRKEEEEAGQEEVQQRPIKAPEEASEAKAEPVTESPVSPPSVRPSPGTTDPEEASRLLAEKRRQAREQREREEERRQQEEAERRHQEEMSRRKAEERARREEEARRLAEEKKRVEEEGRRLEQERLQREREEAERLQRQKEEEEADRLRQEREKHFRKEEAERLERKKRLEEIMKRTRRSEQKSTGQKNGDVGQPCRPDLVNSAPGSPSMSVSTPQTPNTSENSDRNGHTNPNLGSHTLPSAGHSVNAEPQLRENGIVTDVQVFEEVIEVPVVTKLSRQEGVSEEEEERRKAPVLAFQENGSVLSLAATENSQTKHQAHV